MSSFVFDAMLGQVAYYATLPGSTDNLIVVPIDGGETDVALRVRDNLADVLTANAESMIGRLVATSVTSADGVVGMETATNGWDTPIGEAIVTRVLICYKPATGSADSAILPLVSLDTDFFPDGVSDVAMSFDPFFVATSGIVDQGQGGETA